jgi:uncharacterized membrane protein
MIESHIHEWANLLLRWIHFIVGVAWIGASFYFNWLENNLNRKLPQEPGIAGNLWAVHGGGFYHLKKFKTGPEQLPAHLHWFKWEAYTTWLSGMTLLIVIYYLNARLYLIDPSVRNLAPGPAIVVSLVSILGSWFVYDALCRTALKNHTRLLAGSLILYLAILAWFLADVFSGRAAYIHVGAAIGTMMVGNVFFVIIPAQREMVSALEQGRDLDPSVGGKGLLRSTHNNYLTLPVLFIMISNHFPSTYGHEWNWLVLIMVSLASIIARHYFNVRVVMKSLWWLLPLSFAAMVGVMWFTAPNPVATSDSDSTQDASVSVMSVVSQRCTVCHSKTPTQPGFSAPPLGLALDSMEQLEVNADKVFQAAVLTKTMPIGNLTNMTEEERNLLAGWYNSFSKKEN